MSQILSSSEQTNQSQAEASPHGDGRSQPGTPFINIGETERWVSTFAGGLLVVQGLKMRSIPGAVLAFVGGAMVHRGVTGHCNTYQALSVHRGSGAGAAPQEYSQRGIHVSQSITIGKPADEIYRFWRNFENLPRVMGYLKSVKQIDEKRSSWTARGPGGMNVQWDAELINDVPDKAIAWRSLYPATVNNAGSVRFSPGPEDFGTEVTVTLDYIPPAGNIGWAVNKLFGTDPAAEVLEDLRRLKAILETGEAPTIEGQSHGKRSMIGSLLSSNS